MMPMNCVGEDRFFLKLEDNPQFFTEIESPVGKLLITGSSSSITGVYIGGGRFVPSIQRNWIREAYPFREAIVQLQEYFSGKRREFDLAISIETGTLFQKRVWNELSQIPFGKTLSYGELARIIGKAGASRAVGTANSRNPISIVIPCHRVIGANGNLSGYAGGLSAKKWLLLHESKY